MSTKRDSKAFKTALNKAKTAKAAKVKKLMALQGEPELDQESTEDALARMKEEAASHDANRKTLKELDESGEEGGLTHLKNMETFGKVVGNRHLQNLQKKGHTFIGT